MSELALTQQPRVLLLDEQHDLLVVGTAMSPEFVYLIPVDGGLAPDPARFGVMYLPEAFLAKSADLDGAVNQIIGQVHDPSPTALDHTLKRIEEVYGDKVRRIWKHYPLKIHKDAPLAHVASMAAQEQGKFWEYHDKLFIDTRKLKLENLKQYAREVGLDMELFDKAITDLGKTKVIEADVRLLHRLVNIFC